MGKSDGRVEFNFTDSATHRVSIYCVDYDSRNRAQTVEMLDNSEMSSSLLVNGGSPRVV